MPRPKTTYKQRQHLKRVRNQQQFSNKKAKNVAENSYGSTSDDNNIALSNLVNISTISASSQSSDIGNKYISNDSHNDNTLSNLEINNTSAISVSSQQSDIEIDLKQQKIDQLLEYAVDLPDSVLTKFISIIKKLAQNQFHQSQYLKIWDVLLNIIMIVDNDELSLGVSLLKLMRYNKGPKSGKIFSKHLQQKAYDFIERSLYRPKNSIKYRKPSSRTINRLKKNNKSLNNRIRKYKRINKKNISLARSTARKKPTITNKQLKLAIQDRLMTNKKQYNAKTVSMATQICEIGEMSYRSAVTCTKKVIEWLIDEEPNKWFSVSTLVGWHKDVSNIYITQQCAIAKTSKWFNFGIMADESTRGDSKIFVICFMYWDLIANEPKVTLLELEDLAQCSGASVASAVIKACNQYQLDPTKCLIWTTDNTAYMSGRNGKCFFYYV